MTCTRAREFLERKKLKVVEQVTAGKNPQGPKEALALAAKARRVVSAKGTRMVTLDPRTASKEEILAVMLGPTGNLRAPTLVVGETLYVGFPKEGFEALK